MKQKLVKKMDVSVALNFSKKCYSHLHSKKKGEKVTCPCCGDNLTTGNFKWVQHVAAVKAWVTRRGGNIIRMDAAIKANKTRKTKSASAKIQTRITNVIKGTEHDLIRDDLLLEWK